MIRLFRRLLGLKIRRTYFYGRIELTYWGYSEEECYNKLKKECPSDYPKFSLLG